MAFQVILTACIVYSAFTICPGRSKAVDQAIPNHPDRENSLRVNFHDLFNSIADNNAGKGDYFREMLRDKVTVERQAFDAANEELRTSRHRNIHKTEDRNVAAESNVPRKRRAYKPAYEQEREKLEEMFRKTHNLTTMRDKPWELIDNPTEELLETACRDVAAAITPSFIVNQTNYIPAKNCEHSLAMERVRRYAPVLFTKEGMQFVNGLVICPFEEMDFYVGQGPDDNHVFAFTKDRLDQIWYIRSGLHEINIPK